MELIERNTYSLTFLYEVSTFYIKHIYNRSRHEYILTSFSKIQVLSIYLNHPAQHCVLPSTDWEWPPSGLLGCLLL